MNTKTFWIAAIAVFAVCASGTALAVKPDWAGGGRGGGGNSDKGDLYGDQLVIDRDIDGVPLLNTEGNVQPIVWLAEIPEGCDVTGLEPVPPESMYEGGAVLIPLDEEGEIPGTYGECAIEPHLGRLSVARGPAEVREMALDEAEDILGLGDNDLDPAGRLRVLYYDEELGAEVLRTIDASVENLAMYEAVMEQGELPTESIVSLYPSWLHAAAALLGTAADKTGDLTVVDVTQLVNAFMAVPSDVDPLVNDPYQLNVGGQPQKFYDFSGFEYVRSESFGRELCYLKVVEPVPDVGPFLVEVTTESVMQIDGLFEGDYSGENIVAFAQAADDTRRVVNFMHTHTIPEELLFACETEELPMASAPQNVHHLLELPN